ncbi:rhodopsin kinase grk7a [Brachyhypopomus gauderio]|uniref:rhodopsin kinase grk7a n=1 Tax=Brachyhypopomus gauderio TaxID=698409 RepID=UPI004040FECE
MCDMGALDNLVANTAYLKAQGGDDKELKKRRRSLALPKPEQCTGARSSVPSDFESLCEVQPIGKRFFREFLGQGSPEFIAAAEFLDELTEWDLAEDAARDKACTNIINRFCKEGSKSFLSYLSGDILDKCKAVTEKDFEEVMGKVREGTKEFLKGKPFADYKKSPVFDKFLQWKEYERQPITEKYFYEFRTLGKGGFGEVCAVQVKNTGQMYACKKLCKKRLKKKHGQNMALLEKRILEKVNSPFVVNLAYAYETKSHLCLVMTLMNGGDLKYHIYNIGEKGIEMERIIYYTAQVITGILHLHAMNIVYRDMKPENVLLDSQGQCRLSDLGLAVELPAGKTSTQKAGTGAYMAPEILTETPYRTSVDWWSLGVSIYEMVAGYTPFRGPDSKKEKLDKEEVQRRIINEEPRFDHKNFNASTKDIVQQFLKKNVDERLGCKEDDPRKHEWFKSINFPRLEAGLITPPWLPKPNVVYAKDTGDIAEFSDIRGIGFDAKDEKFFKEFSTGAVSVHWQKEMIDTGLFDELNDPSRSEPSGVNGDMKSGTCTLL